MKKKQLTLKEMLINWARSCHFDGMIVVKEVKGKRWMQFLNSLEAIFDFDIDEMNQKEAWNKIKTSIENLSSQQAIILDVKRRSKY